LRPRAIAILGPTGCGKSAFAMRLAAELPVEIISVDSAQVYRGMDIGTAKPTAAERSAVPHHLIDIREPEQTYSAGEFRADCLKLLQEITARA
jgi:tRNA dimethylallyltransferase